MLVLCPPSEGKTAPSDGPPLDLDTLVHADALGPTRERVLSALEKVARGPRRRALERLGLSEGQSDEVERDAHLREAPTAPAAEVYTGVLYQRLDLPSLTPRARGRAAERILVASALWGVVRLEDRIPAYRLAIGATLPALRKGLAAVWRPALTAALPDAGLVVDLRSGPYAAAWRPREATVVAVRAFTAERRPVSHMAKATRGDVARLVAQARSDPKDPEGLAALVERAGHAVELTPPAKAGAPWHLDVIAPG